MLDMAFARISSRSSTPPRSRRTLLFSATMPKPIVALARRYPARGAAQSRTVARSAAIGDISYQAVTLPRPRLSRRGHCLRFTQAEDGDAFCATRDNVRHLRLLLAGAGSRGVALSGEHSQSERNNGLQALRDRAPGLRRHMVAARGIDLPSLSLIVHVEIPRDAEILQHRSGRTGRAGKKGTAVLIVPYPRRRQVEMMLRGARIEAEWLEAPGPEEIRRKDRDRLIEALLAPVEADDEDREIAREILAQRSPEELAAALVRAHRAAMPAPEELVSAGSPEGRVAAHRAGFEDTLWFRMDIGRRHNADPRWLLPLICRRGMSPRTRSAQSASAQ